MQTLYDTSAGVRRYAEISEGIDGRELVDLLVDSVEVGAPVLELGSGLGKDARLLAEHLTVTASDASVAFLAHLRSTAPELEVLGLDARSLAPPALPADRRFAAIYSNKVLHHLERDELRASFATQRHRLRSGGWALHTFWPGTRRIERDGLLFQEHDEASLRAALREGWLIERCFYYSELGHHDSLALLLRAI